MWEWDSENEFKKRRDLQLSEKHGGISIFVKEELSVKNEHDDGKNTISDEEITTTTNKDPLEMKMTSALLQSSVRESAKGNTPQRSLISVNSVTTALQIRLT